MFSIKCSRLLIVLSIVRICSSETASFYGSSYVNVPYQDAKSTTEISFAFRTKHLDAFLFLAAGKTDYCFVLLEAGKLKVKINLGAGESEISSPRGLRLDDLHWHLVNISRKEGDLNLAVDKIHIVREKLPIGFYELNMYGGLYIGGQGDFSELFLGHTNGLRGCLRDIRYNAVTDVLSRARWRTGRADAHSISWGCVNEFDAPRESSISFLENGAYMAIPSVLTSRTNVKWQFSIKTISETGLILYNSKKSSTLSRYNGNVDFVGVELVGGKIRVAQNWGSGVTELYSDVTINDGVWHSINVAMEAGGLDVTIDSPKHKYHLSFNNSAQPSKHLDLSTVLYVGGLEVNMRSGALASGMLSAGNSFKGCIRGISNDGRALGLPDALDTSKLISRCVWSYPCTEKPCVHSPDIGCSQIGINSFKCTGCENHNDPQCVRPEFVQTHNTMLKVPLPISIEVLTVNNLIVAEGSTATITTSIINLILDYNHYGIREAAVQFHIVQPFAKHGKLNIESSKLSIGNSISTFNMLNILKNEVFYVHDGSESTQDLITLDLEFVSNEGLLLPDYLQGRQRFELLVNITPENDNPTVRIPSDYSLLLAQGSWKMLDKDKIVIIDRDSSPERLIVSIINITGGYLETTDNPNIPLETFSVAQMDHGFIGYRHTSNDTGHFSFTVQVSDGEKESAITTIPIDVYSLSLTHVQNTGAILAYKSSVVITPSNLTFITNADDSSLELTFKIVKYPKFGVIKLTDGEQAQDKISFFNNHQLEKKLVSYVHNSEGSPTKDFFKFELWAGKIKLGDTFKFEFNFVEVHLIVDVFGPLKWQASSEAVIKSDSIKVQTHPILLHPSSIIFELTKTSHMASIYLRNKPLVDGETWTQNDIDSGFLILKLHHDTYSPATDILDIKISAPRCQPIASQLLNFEYSPSSLLAQAVSAFIHPLEVTEGSSSPLTDKHISIKCVGVNQLRFEILSGPDHGYLHLLINNNTVKNVTVFTEDDLYDSTLSYSHDGSENNYDNFKFLATSKNANFQFVGLVNISIQLINDNPPSCVTDENLRVVTGGDRTITNRNLQCQDKDIDTPVESLIFTINTISNGMILNTVNDPFRTIMKFTQEEVNNGKLIYRDEFSSDTKQTRIGVVELGVFDGKHSIDLKLQVESSPAFIKILNNSQLMLRQGGAATITTNHIYADTNLNIHSDKIIYQVVEGPGQGEIELGTNLEPLKTTLFSQAELEANHVRYRHNGDVESVRDRVLFRVSAGSTVFRELEFDIRLLPQYYWEPLEVTKNSPVIVDESTTIAITKQYLEIKQDMVPSSDIMYLVKEPPHYGYLERESNDEEPGSSENNHLITFNQSLINSGHLYYVQSTMNQSTDRLVVDITNGVVSLYGLVISFVIVPKNVYLTSSQLNVIEGGNVTLSANTFPVMSSYYTDRISRYSLVSAPNHGRIVRTTADTFDPTIDFWSPKQLARSQIMYVHDGSESTDDSFSVKVAVSDEKESAPVDVEVKVNPVNNQKPSISRNTGIKVWKGGIGLITSDNLTVEDKDTDVSNLTFVISSSKCGQVVLESQHAERFTQAQIDQNIVFFKHSGENCDGELELMATDGLHSTGLIYFKITAEQASVKLLVNNPLRVFPMLGRQLTIDHLLAQCDDPNYQVTYIIKNAPMYGVVTKSALYESNQMAVTNFTQKNINESAVWYHHLSKDFSSNTSTDIFTFDVICEFANPIVNQTFNLEITVSSGGLEELLIGDKTKELVVKEGESTVIDLNTTAILTFLINSIGIRAPVIKIELINEPKNGKVCLDDDCDRRIFAQGHMRRNQVRYVHDHSDTLSDSLEFSVYLDTDPTIVPLCNVTIPISIIPVNDQPFFLTQAFPSLRLVQGQSVTLTRSELLTEDPDTPPEQIVYDIITVPVYGNLYLAGIKNSIRFTQADIDAGEVVYKHDGQLKPTSFYFRVWDGQFNPVYKVLEIYVIPVTLNVTVSFPLPLLQGTYETVVNEKLFQVETNGDKDSVAYNITTNPRHGVVYINGTKSKLFSHKDLKDGRVIYRQTDLTAAADALRLSAEMHCEESPIIKDLWLNISVEPLVKTGAFYPLTGLKSQLGVQVLNAEMLAKTTNSDPKYKILRKPKYGKLKKIVRRSGDKQVMREVDVTKFTHGEIASGIVYFVAKKVPEPIEDSFPFLLTANGVQPAIGELRFHVSVAEPPSTTTPHLPTFTTFKYSPTSVNKKSDIVEIARPNMSDDYLLCVGFIMAVVVASLVIVVLVRCRSKKRAEELDKMNPMPLPCPPDDLMTTSPGMEKNENHGCKVIALGPPEHTEPETDFNMRYPYGAADEEYSSSADGTEQNNPMLRRNQYWV
ncbi:Concanavalin A-like lectin/glucanase domain,Laminin G domain [Cinara cedri]|uniref:Concanavalin A-like lectin/glucanase domain,Laminin G domain n=1 Tax=Cinara cedri TaxID=506608 RepID=A0A5E4N1T7_9HEMI|nr:Concanavalin A-like lectin/glucanase domain,Laminin G domain [Cinara cedri]